MNSEIAYAEVFMVKTPKSMRLHIGVFGRTNTGKSSFINFLTAQNVSIVSDKPGTTTDTVEKTMELLPFGPVVFIDTAGIDDRTELGKLRIEKTNKAFDRTDLGIILTEADVWGDYEDYIKSELLKRKTEVIVVINKTDIKKPSEDFKNRLKSLGLNFIECSSIKPETRNEALNKIKLFLKNDESDKKIINDIISKGSTAVLVIPIDKEAPKGRIILPQVQVIRELLDGGNTAVCVRDKEYPELLKTLRPDIVVCDSQAVKFVCENTPSNIKLTTFSILFSRFKGDFKIFVEGAKFVERLRPGDRIAVFEACTHHPIGDDIARVKIPKWLKEKVKGEVKIDYFSGLDFPDDLSVYKMGVHCGGCMINSKNMILRQNFFKEKNIPITNYGMLIAACNGCLERVLTPFKI